MIKYNELIKFQSSYCKAPLEQITDPTTGEERPWRFYIYENRAPTLRLASGKYSINRKPYRYFAPLNGMSLPKPAQLLRGLDYNPYTYDFKFYPDKETDKGQFLVETYSDRFNMRAAFIPPSDDYICVKCDYCLTLDSKIMTTEGERTLESLLGKEFKVVTPVGNKKAFNCRKTGKHRIYTFELDSGKILRCSAEHRIAIKRDGKYMWEYACKVRLTDSILEYEQINNGITWNFL